MATKRGTERVLVKLNKSVENGDYYEAHQMYRTLYFRYLSSQKYTEAIDLLYNGAMKLLSHNQHQSGGDLALLLIDVLSKSETDSDKATIDKLGEIHRLFKCSALERPEYVSRALKWSSETKSSSRKSGHPDLHHQFAMTTWKEKNYSLARYHFVHSMDGEGCATMLVEFHVMCGFPSEVDLFIVQAVLQMLCLHNKVTADTTFRCYTEQHPQVEDGPPFVRPLLNFLWLLLIAIDGGKVAVFTILVEQYRASLSRDPCYNQYLDKIGQLFFGLPPPARNMSGLGGLFGGGLFQSLFNMGDSSDDEEDTQVPSGSSIVNTPVGNDELD